MADTPKHPSRWLAAILSLHVCGLGQLYSGRPRRALLLYLLAWPVLLVSLLLCFRVESTPANGILALVLFLSYRTYVIVDSVRTALHGERGWFGRWYVWFPLLWIVLWGDSFFLEGAAGAEEVKTTAMMGALLRGDVVLVDRMPGYRPGRFDVVAYRATEKGPVEMGRVLGLPGEMVETHGQKMVIEGEPIKEPYARYGANQHQDFGPETVPEDCYFVVGDNRDRSRDSRDPKIGFIPKSRIVGRTRLVLVSIGEDWPLTPAKRYFHPVR